MYCRCSFLSVTLVCPPAGPPGIVLSGKVKNKEIQIDQRTGFMNGTYMYVLYNRNLPNQFGGCSLSICSQSHLQRSHNYISRNHISL